MPVAAAAPLSQLGQERTAAGQGRARPPAESEGLSSGPGTFEVCGPETRWGKCSRWLLHCCAARPPGPRHRPSRGTAPRCGTDAPRRGRPAPAGHGGRRDRSVPERAAEGVGHPRCRRRGHPRRPGADGAWLRARLHRGGGDRRLAVPHRLAEQVVHRARGDAARRRRAAAAWTTRSRTICRSSSSTTRAPTRSPSVSCSTTPQGSPTRWCPSSADPNREPRPRRRPACGPRTWRRRPGTSWSYHNPNYQVAARLVEVLSGEPFDRYLRRHILEPAGMASSTSTATDDEPVPGLTEGHVTAYGHAFTAPGPGSYTVGDGGIVSSAADMARWLIVNANGGQAADGTRLVSGEGMRAAAHPERAAGSAYALGWDDPRSDRRPDPAGAQRQPVHLHLRGGALAGIRVRGGAAVQRRLADDARPDRDRARRLRHHRRHRPALERPAPGRDAGHRPGRWLTLAALILGRLRRRPCRSLGSPPPRRPAAHGARPASGGDGARCRRAAFPRLAEAWIGRDVTWRAAAYAWPALVVFVLAALLAAAATLLARAWQWWRTAAAISAPTSLPPSRDRLHRCRDRLHGGDPGHLTGVSNPVRVHAQQQRLTRSRRRPP